MPKYQYAKPFDIIRVIQDLQVAVRQLQVRSSGQVGSWQQATMSNGWSGTINYRVVGSQAQFSAYRLVQGTTTAGTIIATTTLVSVGLHETVMTSSTGVAGGLVALNPNGTLTVANSPGGAARVSFEATFSLDI